MSEAQLIFCTSNLGIFIKIAPNFTVYALFHAWYVLQGLHTTSRAQREENFSTKFRKQYQGANDFTIWKSPFSSRSLPHTYCISCVPCTIYTPHRRSRATRGEVLSNSRKNTRGASEFYKSTSSLLSRTPLKFTASIISSALYTLHKLWTTMRAQNEENSKPKFVLSKRYQSVLNDFGHWTSPFSLSSPPGCLCT